MVGKVVDDGDAADLGLYFQAPLHTLESFQRLRDRGSIHAVLASQCRGSRRVQNVVRARQGKFQIGPTLSVLQNSPGSTVSFELQIHGPPCRLLAESIHLDGAKRFADALAHIGARVVSDDVSPAWNKIYQPLEGGLHRIEVLIDVGVIEFNM